MGTSTMGGATRGQGSYQHAFQTKEELRSCMAAALHLQMNRMQLVVGT